MRDADRIVPHNILLQIMLMLVPVCTAPPPFTFPDRNKWWENGQNSLTRCWMVTSTIRKLIPSIQQNAANQNNENAKKKISSSTTLEHWLVRCTSMSSNYLVIIARWKTLTDTKNYAEWRSTNCWCSTKIDVRIKTKRLQFNDFTIRCKLIKNPESKSKFYGCALIVFVHIRRFYWTLLRAPK